MIGRKRARLVCFAPLPIFVLATSIAIGMFQICTHLLSKATSCLHFDLCGKGRQGARTVPISDMSAFSAKEVLDDAVNVGWAGANHKLELP